MFWKKKKLETPEAPESSRIILGMVILQDENHFDVDSLLKDYNSNYESKIEELSGDNSSTAFKIDGEMVGIGYMSFPIPYSDVEETARYAYNWQSVLKDIKDHNSHLIVSILQGGQDQVKRFKIFTQVVSSLLRTTNSLGIYQGTQSLLIPKADYLEQADLMSSDYLPLYLWIYFGLRRNMDGNSGYTYGLKEFNKTELEILNSSRSLVEVRNFLFDIAHYVLDYNVNFREGQTCGASEHERISISLSKGEFVEGDSFKLAY